MYAERHAVTVITDATGAGAGYTPVVTGQVLQIVYVKPSAGGYEDGSTMTVTGEESGTPIWAETAVNATATRLPRTPVQNNAGVALTYDGTRTVCEPVVVVKERVKIALANGGDSKVGTFYVVVG